MTPNFWCNDHEQKNSKKGEQVEHMKSHGDEKVMWEGLTLEFGTE